MLSNEFLMLVGGELKPGTEKYEVINPADGKAFASAPNCTATELEETIRAAQVGFTDWRSRSMDQRRQAVLSFAEAIAQNADSLASILTKEQGKPHLDATMDILGGVQWLIETAKLELPTKTVEDSDDRIGVSTRVPLGVVAAIIPWNFPITLAMFKVAPALIAGNAVILKPAPTTPLTTLKLGEIAKDIFPDGVLNIVSGDHRLGPWLTSHDGIDKVSFTGSTETGRQVMASAAPSLKRLTLELGGNDAAIIAPDVDVDAIAEHIFWAAFRNTGQICIATKRFYIHEDIYDDVRNAIVDFAATVKVGDGSEQGTQIGPIQNRAQFNRVVDLIDDARSNGYEFACGGDVPETDGYFVPVSILDNPPEHARIVQEEQFGPVLPLVKVASLDDAIERANASEFGLGASVWCRDANEAQRIADALNVGTVWVNEGQYLTPHAPFGGHKQSGIGVEGGVEGLCEFTVAKTIFTRKSPLQPLATAL